MAAVLSGVTGEDVSVEEAGLALVTSVEGLAEELISTVSCGGEDCTAGKLPGGDTKTEGRMI
jgi:hypothetical protein